MNRQQAIELANKIKEIRKKKNLGDGDELSYAILLRLKDMGWGRRQMAMKRLVMEGYADSVETIERMLKSKKVSMNVDVGDSPTESTGMSDDVLDAGIQYLGINQDLL